MVHRVVLLLLTRVATMMPCKVATWEATTTVCRVVTKDMTACRAVTKGMATKAMVTKEATDDRAVCTII